MFIFHIVNRGIDERKIFLDDSDKVRFIHGLFEFNNTVGTYNTLHFFNKNSNEIKRAHLEEGWKNRKPRKLLVSLHAFVLMDNHYHLLVSPKVEGGVSRFIQKLNAGYTLYFNHKYEREGKGPLFSGTKKIQVLNDSHFIHLPYYIHFNPLDKVMPEWRKREMKDYKKAVDYLNKYRWSSHLDYMGIKNFPSVTQRDFLCSIFGGKEGYKNSIEGWLKEIDIDIAKSLISKKKIIK